MWVAILLGSALALLALRVGVRIHQFRTVADVQPAGLRPRENIRTTPLLPQFLEKFIDLEQIRPLEPVVSIILNAGDEPREVSPHLAWCLRGVSEARDLTVCGFDVDGIPLEAFEQLESLQLMECEMTNAKWSRLENLPALNALYLYGSTIDDDALVVVGRHRQIEELCLVECPVTDAGIRKLRHMPKLRQLLLKKVAVTDAGLLELRTLPHLRELSLLQTDVTEEGCAELQRHLPDLILTDD
jgi:hypothetical protein